LFLVIALPFIYAAFKAIEWRWWVSGVRIGEVHFESNMTGGALIDLYWKVIGWGALFALALSMWFGIVLGLGYAYTAPSAQAGQRFVIATQQIPVLIALGVGYVAIALASGAAMRIYLIRDVWQRVADSVTVHNIAAAENVAARGDLVSALGEGFADSLDVVGF